MYIVKKVKHPTHLEAGVATKAFTMGAVNGAPFMKADQPGTCPGIE